MGGYVQTETERDCEEKIIRFSSEMETEPRTAGTF